MCLPGGVLALRGGQHLTEDRLGDVLGCDAGPFEHRADDGGPEIMGRGVGETAVEAADRRPCGRCDDDAGHADPPWRSACALRSSVPLQRDSLQCGVTPVVAYVAAPLNLDARGYGVSPEAGIRLEARSTATGKQESCQRAQDGAARSAADDHADLSGTGPAQPGSGAG